MSRIHTSVLIAIALLAGPPLAQAQDDDKQLTLSELQKLIEQQQKQLEKQQELLEEQSQTIKDQSDALKGLKTQLDQMSLNLGTKAPELSKDELALRERLSKVEEDLANPPDTPENVLTAGDFPGSIRIPGTGMASRFGGFVRLGVVYSLDPIGSKDRFVAGSIPVGDVSSDDFLNQGFVISAQRSRLNWDLRLDSSVGQFRAFVEGDFAGDGGGGSDVLRLRHAYGQYNRFILGQTWTTLQDQAAEPEDVDFEGLNAQVQTRQAQLRWTKGLGGNRPFALSFEDPSPSITGGTGISKFPDTIARITKKRDWGHLQLGAIVRSIAGFPVDDTGQELTNNEDSAFGWGLTFSGNLAIKKWDRRDNFKFQVSGGDGLGRYINDLGTVGGFDAVFDPDLNLETLQVLSGYVAFQHWWRRNPLGLFKAVRSTFVYGYVRVDDLDFLPEDFYRSTQRATVNYLWSPISEIDLGMEFLWGSRENKDRERNTAKQFQFVATFRF